MGPVPCGISASCEAVVEPWREQQTNETRAVGGSPLDRAGLKAAHRALSSGRRREYWRRPTRKNGNEESVVHERGGRAKPSVHIGHDLCRDRTDHRGVRKPPICTLRCGG